MHLQDPFGMLGGVAPPAASPQFPSVTAWQKGPVSISFSFAKEADPSTTIITATYTNAGEQLAAGTPCPCLQLRCRDI